ncbi:hypothetical protein NCS52_00322200 [Fusarium sp. LHS14.1]|nr:hypothetical protein NCS52_00322200 [Fusarium sp. LHS14.1]
MATQATLPPRKLPGADAPVGVLRIDHPEPVGEAEKPIQHSAARMAGAPAFLDLMLLREFRTVYGDGSWEEPIWQETLWGGDIMSPPKWAFLWRDQDGHPLKHEFVQFADGVTKKDAMIRAITEYDRNERARVDTYNRQILIDAGRCRVAKFARDGTAAPPRIYEGDRLEDLDFATPKFAIDCLEETDEFVRSLAASVRAANARARSPPSFFP